MTRDEALEKGYATFNGGPHLCVDVPEGHCTVTVKTPDGGKVTMAFLPRIDGSQSGHSSVDIVSHENPKTKNGHPKQSALLLGEGPTNGSVDFEDEEPTTIVVLKIPSFDREE